MKRLLVLEPYYGGSHKLFLQGLQATVQADYTLLTLPPRKWKMRMQFSAIYFAGEISGMAEDERFFDTVLCSSFIDVAVLRSLLASVAGWNHRASIATYFHENQFAYPTQEADVSLRQFSGINFTTALVSDRCAFNSRYNMETFLTGIESVLKKAPDMKLSGSVSTIRRKSMVLHPGMDYSSIDRVTKKEYRDKIPVIVWNHRWEHDKGPEDFFDALYLLQEKGLAFRLIVLGQSFARSPDCFSLARKRLAGEIIHFGYVESRKEYAALLHRGDCIVSTASHEFFGIAVLEGIRAGCYPLLPAALSYPELYEEEFFYEPGRLAHRLQGFLANPVRLDSEKTEALTASFDWQTCGEQYKQWLFANKREGK